MAAEADGRAPSGEGPAAEQGPAPRRRRWSSRSWRPSGPRMRRRNIPVAPRPAPLHWILRRLGFDRDAEFVIAVVIAAALGGFAAVGLRAGISRLQAVFFGVEGQVLHAALSTPAWRRFAAPLIGGLLAGIALVVVRRYVRAGGGMATIMEAVSIRHGLVSLRSALGRTVASVLAMAGGGSVGREGPIIAIAAAAASWTGRLAKLREERLRVLVACGAAAGFAAAYNTPVAATLFVLEIVVGSFALEVLAPVAISAVVATLVTRLQLGDQSIYRMRVFQLETGWELLAYAALGLAAAAASALFLEAIQTAERLFRRIPWTPARTALGGAIVGALGFLGVPYVYGNGYEVASLVLEGDKVLPMWLAVIFVAKIIATSSTVGSGSPGGVFTPTLLLGATLGGALGNAVHAALPLHTAPPQGYALVGMGAMMAATVQAPLLSVVFVFEVSRRYDASSTILLPLLVACILASIASRRIHPLSIYMEELKRRGLSWGGRAEERVLRAIHVRDVMRSAPKPLAADSPVPDLVARFLETPAAVVYLTEQDEENGHDRYVGAVDFQAAKRAIHDPELQDVEDARDLAHAVETLRPDDTLVQANERLWHADTQELPVLRPDGTLEGVLTRRDLLAAIDREVLRRNVLLAKIRWKGDEGTVTDFLELPEGQGLEQVPIPERYVGRTFAGIDLRGHYGLNALCVLRPDANGKVQRFMPRGQDRLAAGDLVVVMGQRSAIERFESLSAGEGASSGEGQKDATSPAPDPPAPGGDAAD